MEIFNPAFNYDELGHNYSNIRQEEPSILKIISEELMDCKTIINIGAGAGSYEPANKYIIALEPSMEMRKQRISNKKIPAINGKSDNIPFDNNSFDCSMSILSIHHWPDMEKGITEMMRVSKNKVLIMTFDPDHINDFWNYEYFPEVIEIERKRYPKIAFLEKVFNKSLKIIKVPIPFDCKDGFQEAFFGRPEAFLHKEIREAQSAWGFIDKETEERIEKKLEKELNTGEWDRKYGNHRKMKEFTCALRIIIYEK
jgi:SAM-dependent methyltransferase